METSSRVQGPALLAAGIFLVAALAQIAILSSRGHSLHGQNAELAARVEELERDRRVLEQRSRFSALLHSTFVDQLAEQLATHADSWRSDRALILRELNHTASWLLSADRELAGWRAQFQDSQEMHSAHASELRALRDRHERALAEVQAMHDKHVRDMRDWAGLQGDLDAARSEILAAQGRHARALAEAHAQHDRDAQERLGKHAAALRALNETAAHELDVVRKAAAHARELYREEKGASEKSGAATLASCKEALGKVRKEVVELRQYNNEAWEEVGRLERRIQERSEAWEESGAATLASYNEALGKARKDVVELERQRDKAARAHEYVLQEVRGNLNRLTAKWAEEKRRIESECEDECNAFCSAKLSTRHSKNEVARKAGNSMKTATAVGGGMLFCTLLWDATALLGNPLALPGITDNILCGTIASASALWRGSMDDD